MVRDFAVEGGGLAGDSGWGKIRGGKGKDGEGGWLCRRGEWGRIPFFAILRSVRTRLLVGS